MKNLGSTARAAYSDLLRLLRDNKAAKLRGAITNKTAGRVINGPKLRAPPHAVLDHPSQAAAGIKRSGKRVQSLRSKKGYINSHRPALNHWKGTRPISAEAEEPHAGSCARRRAGVYLRRGGGARVALID